MAVAINHKEMNRIDSENPNDTDIFARETELVREC